MVTAKKTPVVKAEVTKKPVAAPKVATAAKKVVTKAAPVVKPVAVTPVAPAPAPVKAATAKKAAPAKPKASTATNKKSALSQEQRNHYVEVAAFYIAERRGFAPGNPVEDWASAEEEVDRLIASGHFTN